MHQTMLLFAAFLVGMAGDMFWWVRSAECQSTRSEAVREANMSTVGIAAGRTEGAPLRFAAELARALDDGDKMRLLPIVTRGPFENVKDLLFLRGVDMAIVYGDVLEHYKKHPPLPEFESRINYITHLFPSEVHVFARPEISKLEDLAGKPVNFNTKGTAAAYSGPLIFERLGIKVDAQFNPHPTALREMAVSDKYAATVWVSTKPLDPFLKGQWAKGFKFLPVPLTGSLEEYYLPAQLDAADYPQIIPAGERVPTISVPAVLAVYAWQQDSDRYRRVGRFIDYFAERLPILQNEPGFHPRWKDINLAAAVPGWRRFPAMQAKIEELSLSRGHRTAVSDETRSMPAPEQRSFSPVTTRPQRPADAITEREALGALAQAGFHTVGPLRLDERRFWVGTATRGTDRSSVAVDRMGIVHSRRLPKQ
jgi:TRAP-type uncharacterized transport system substrate-binding protein